MPSKWANRAWASVWWIATSMTTANQAGVTPSEMAPNATERGQTARRRGGFGRSRSAQRGLVLPLHGLDAPSPERPDLLVGQCPVQRTETQVEGEASRSAGR